MCLRGQRKYVTMVDGTGYKLMFRRPHLAYQSLYGNFIGSAETWRMAEPLFAWGRCNVEYGFHAYEDLDGARDALAPALKYNYGNRPIVVVSVELSDIFGDGEDNSFSPEDYPSDRQPRCVVARAMRILSEVN